MRRAGTVTLETPRLVLRRFVMDDAPDMFAAWAGDEEVARFMRWCTHKNVDETRATLAGWMPFYERDDYFVWAMVLKETGALIGSIGVLTNEEGSGWEPGYNIGRAHWNRGYTSEALRAVLRYFVQATGAEEMTACRAVANPASGRVLEKAGFVRTCGGFYTKMDGTSVPAVFYHLDTAAYAGAESTLSE